MRRYPIPRDQKAWRELVERQTASGLTVREFCRREGLSAWSLYEWRSKLRNGGAEDPPALAGKVSSPRAVPFIDLGALEPGRSRCEVRLELGGGVVLQVLRG